MYLNILSLLLFSHILVYFGAHRYALFTYDKHMPVLKISFIYHVVSSASQHQAKKWTPFRWVSGKSERVADTSARCLRPDSSLMGGVTYSYY